MGQHGRMKNQIDTLKGDKQNLMEQLKANDERHQLKVEALEEKIGTIHRARELVGAYAAWICLPLHKRIITAFKKRIDGLPL